nr:Gag-Pol polyprotein [Tanacetum cinerariifolium]
MNDHHDIGKLKEKGDIGFFIGYSENGRGYRVYNRRTRKVMETTNVKFDELSTMATLGTVDEPKQQEDVTKNGNDAVLDDNIFVNPFGTPSTKSIESSSRSFDPSNMHTFYQRYSLEHKWTKDYPIEQVLGDPSKPVMTRKQLATDPKMCIYALIMNTSKLKNIK